MKNKTASLAIIVALAVAVTLSSGLVLTPYASAAKNVCENKESNPNCFVPPLCGQPSCAVFIPGSASPNK
jgi:hypothetical protein